VREDRLRSLESPVERDLDAGFLHRLRVRRADREDTDG
jgi:hypothetical protein